jgi:hypothetical protein
MVDHEGNAITNGYQGFIPVTFNIVNDGTVTIVTAYNNVTLSDNPTQIAPATHKGNPQWPDLPS